MAITANVHEAKTRFSELLERAHKGEEVIIAKAGKPYARLVPVTEAVSRQPGAFRACLESSTGNRQTNVSPVAPRQRARRPRARSASSAVKRRPVSTDRFIPPLSKQPMWCAMASCSVGPERDVRCSRASARSASRRTSDLLCPRLRANRFTSRSVSASRRKLKGMRYKLVLDTVAAGKPSFSLCRRRSGHRRHTASERGAPTIPRCGSNTKVSIRGARCDNPGPRRDAGMVAER